MAMLENRIRMNWEKSRNLKSSEFSFLISSAMDRALALYFSISM